MRCFLANHLIGPLNKQKRKPLGLFRSRLLIKYISKVAIKVVVYSLYIVLSTSCKIIGKNLVSKYSIRIGLNY